jgi:Tfp pilus assembly PilM family ATPase/Tfp pilus assembly protein PilN
MGIFDSFQKWNPLGRRSNAVLGMDIGTDAVRLALVEREGKRSAVRWVHEESLTALQGFADYDSVAPLLQAALRGRFDGRVDVATAPPWSSARVSVQEFPAMDEARFAKAAAWHFQRNPVDDMDHPMHHAIAQATRQTPEGQDVMDGVMVSMDEVMLGGLEELCSGLHLRLRSILPRPLCVAPLVAQQFGASHSILSVDIGAGQTRLTLIVDGSVRLVRRIKPCANDVVRHVCDAAGLSWEDANLAMLAHSGFGRLSDEDADGITARAKEPAEKFIDRLVSQLTGEIERSIAYVEARHATPVSAVCLSGGLAGSPYLLEGLSTSLNHDVARLDPFEVAGEDLGIPMGARTHYNLAIGAATEALTGDGQRNILRSHDLSSSSSGRPASSLLAPRRRRLAAAAVTLGLVVGLGANDIHRARQLHSLEKSTERATHRLDRLSSEADSLGNQRDLFDLADRIEALRDLYDQRQLYTPFLAQVVSNLPDDIWLTQLSVHELSPDASKSSDEVGGEELEVEAAVVHRIRIAGRSQQVDHIGEAVLRLERSRVLDRIEVLKIDEVKDESSKDARFRFEIEGRPIIARRPERTDDVEEVAR